MGCGSSVEFVVNPHISGQTLSLLDTTDKLLLYKYQVDKLFGIFKQLDLDGGGEVSLSEFCATMEIEPTRFTDLVFKLIDRSRKRSFDFEEFVIFCYFFLTLDLNKLNAFAFEMFDINNNGHLDRDEVNMMAEVLWGNERFHANKIGAMLETMEYNIEGDISKSSFLRFIKKFPLILQPAFTIQRNLRVKILGERFWSVVSAQRIEDHGAKTIFEILDIENETWRAMENVIVNGSGPVTAKFVQSLNVAKKHTQRRQTERLERGFAQSKGGLNSTLNNQNHNQQAKTKQERAENAELQKRRKRNQMKDYDAIGVIRRLTVTASDVNGTKYAKLIARDAQRRKIEAGSVDMSPSMNKTASSGNSSDKPKELGRRISHLVVSKLGVMVPKGPKSKSTPADGAEAAQSRSKKPGVAQRLSVLVLGMTRSKQNKQEVRENKYAAATSGTHGQSNSDIISEEKGLELGKQKFLKPSKVTNKKPGMVKRVSMMLGLHGKRSKAVAPAFTDIGEEEEEDE